MSSVHIKTISDQQTWDSLVLSFPEANFLQSWNWGVFHRRLNKTVFNLGIYESGNPVGVCLCVLETAKRGRYLTVAGGPLLDWSNTKLVSAVFSYLKQLSIDHHAAFIRVRPQIFNTPANRHLFNKLGFNPSPMHLTADLTVQLDLTLSPQELLSQMRKNTRYEIKKSEKLNISVITSSDSSEIKSFYQHQLKLASKHHFVPFSYEFLYQQFHTFAADHQALLFHSYHHKHLLASAFIILFGQEAVYHYGISTDYNQKLPGSYAALWAAIQFAKKHHHARFNLWGVAPQNSPHHRFHGVTIFKTGFGGNLIEYLPSHDLPTSKLYPLTNTFESLRARLRHLT